MAIIRGDGGDNILEGTPAPDTIFGFGGHDRIFGRSSLDFDLRRRRERHGSKAAAAPT